MKAETSHTAGSEPREERGATHTAGFSRAGRAHVTRREATRLEIRGTAKGQRRLIDLKPGEIRSVKLEITHNRDRSQVIDSDQK